ncbi:MAG: sugar phosphate isomerase/epimerase [Treponema sp.]|jgi:sugar phosphate isomerase/epimerase|nr:sugar phosphate isomerase/epimerase [Treponema sp.]
MKFAVNTWTFSMAFEDGRLGLEDCFKAMKTWSGNIDGIEILANRRDTYKQAGWVMTKSDTEEFKELVAQYNVIPVCYDSVVLGSKDGTFSHEFKRWRNPSKDDYNRQMAWLKDEIDFCASLGFRFMRAPNLTGFYEEVFSDTFKYAEEKNVGLCMEIHAPLHITGDDIVSGWLELVDKSGGSLHGVIPDFAIFTKELPAPLIRKVLRDGVKEEAVKEICDTFKSGGDIEKTIAVSSEDATLGPLVAQVRQISPIKPGDLKIVGNYIRHVHAKFYEVDENYIEHGIDFAGALGVLKDIGYNAYVSSEYEGFLWEDKNKLDELEQTRRVHAMMQEMLKKV